MSDRDDEVRAEIEAAPPEFPYRPAPLLDRLIAYEPGEEEEQDGDLRAANWIESQSWDHTTLILPPHWIGKLEPRPPVPPPAPGGTAAKTNYSASNIPSGGLFPLVRSDATLETTVSVFNRSAYSIDVIYELRLPNGKVSSTHQKTLDAFAGDRYTPSNFSGSLMVAGHGEAYALQCMQETKTKAGTGVALAEPAGSAGYVWFYFLGVKDGGPGKDRCTIAVYNFHDKDPIYVEVDLGFKKCTVSYFQNGKLVTEQKWVGGTVFEVKVPPLGVHSFRPYDHTKADFDDRVYIGAHTGPNRTGKQVRCFTAAHLFEGTQDIALYNYKRPHYPYASSPNYPKGYLDWHRMYFTAVEDDGKTRADRIHLKLNLAATHIDRKYSFKMHFYEHSGKAAGNPVKVELLGSFGKPDSYHVFSPMKLLGKAFKGSIWIEGAESHTIAPWLEGTIQREAPGKWRDLTDYTPPGGVHQGPSCIPYISDKDKNWRYRIVLFYPKPSLDLAPPAPKDKPPPFSGPKVKIPAKPGGGWVYLQFYDIKGSYRGTYAVLMSADETAFVSFDTDLGQYLSDFEGAVTIEPRNVVVQCQLGASSGDALASTGNWLSVK